MMTTQKQKELVTIEFQTIYDCLYNGAKLCNRANVNGFVNIPPNFNIVKIFDKSNSPCGEIDKSEYDIIFSKNGIPTNQFAEYDCIIIRAVNYRKSHQLSLLLNQINRTYKNFSS